MNIWHKESQQNTDSGEQHQNNFSGNFIVANKFPILE